MGKNFYFTDNELTIIIEYIENSVEALSKGSDSHQKVEKDMENGLGSALRKLYKGKNGEFVYAQYKTKRTKQAIIIALKNSYLYIY